MRRTAALFLLLVFSNIAVAHPYDSGGGGSSSSSEETDLTMIILVAIVAATGTLFLSDILSDNANDSQDALVQEDILPNEETGVNWGQLTGDQQDYPLPLVAVSVFPGENGRNLANYFSNLITQGDGLYYDIYSSPVSFGEMDASEAAATGFSFLSCQLFIAAGSSGLELYSDNSDAPVWRYSTSVWDSSSVRSASSSFIEYALSAYQPAD